MSHIKKEAPWKTVWKNAVWAIKLNSHPAFIKQWSTCHSKCEKVREASQVPESLPFGIRTQSSRPARGPRGPIVATGSRGGCGATSLDSLELDLDAGGPEVWEADLSIGEPFVFEKKLASINLGGSARAAGGRLGQRYRSGFAFGVLFGLRDQTEADIAWIVDRDLDPLGALHCHLKPLKGFVVPDRREGRIGKFCDFSIWNLRHSLAARAFTNRSIPVDFFFRK